MDITQWVVVAVAVVAAAAVGYFTGHRARSEDVPRILVPHRARAILRSLPHGVAVAGRDGRVFYANDRAREWSVALTTGVLTPPLREIVRVALERNDTIEALVPLKTRFASEANQLLVIAAPIEGDNAAVVSVFDAGSPLAARTAHREFVVNVSHELKTPIGALVLMSEALATAADDPDAVRTFARQMERESKRLGLLVEQFIELSRVQSSETVFDGKECDVRDCVESAAEAVWALAQERDVVVDTSGVSSAPITCDERVFVMAMRNLIENAIRYSSARGKVTVSTRIVRDRVEVTVVDQGIGISAYDLPRIFERFFRADDARDRESGGSGLGLAIVKHAARQHGGRVEVWSEPGVGSTFTVTVPLRDSEPANEESTWPR